MVSYDKILFVDESGNENIKGLDRDGVSSFYLVGALIADSVHVNSLENTFKHIAEKHFSKEMKSSNIRRITKRLNVLEDIFKIPNYAVDILVVDKSRLSGGYEYSRTFVKNIQFKLYNSFKSQMCDILIVSDKIKKKRFNEEFERYIFMNLESTFWAKRDKQSVDSKDCYCVQAIDFIVGSILRAYENPDEFSAISDAIPKDRLMISYFPESKIDFLFEIGDPEKEGYDREIAEEAISIANKYIQDNIDTTDESKRIRLSCLQRLIREHIFGEKKDWVQSDDLLSYVNNNCGLNKSKDSLRYHIGKLKEEGILIASRTDGGYKLPCCVNDMELFINNMGSKIVPMIDRMKKARDIIIKSSLNGYDIVEDKPIYKNLISSYEEVKAHEIASKANDNDITN